jgi:hypothetical protein
MQQWAGEAQWDPCKGLDRADKMRVGATCKVTSFTLCLLCLPTGFLLTLPLLHRRSLTAAACCGCAISWACPHPPPGAGTAEQQQQQLQAIRQVRQELQGGLAQQPS